MIGTATAWYDSFLEQNYGRIHWVAITQKFQNKGLAKPLLSFIMNRFIELNHNKVFLRTINIRHNAIGLYLYFGFKPVIRNTQELDTWKDIANNVNHPSLAKLKINL